MSSKKNIWLVSELFYPEVISTGHIMTEIAKYLIQDYQVSVICSSGVYEKKIQKDEGGLSSEIKIYRARISDYNKNSVISRILGQLKITYKLFNCMRKLITHDSEILLVTNPALLTVLAGFFSSFRRWKIKLLVHDVFPDNLVALGALKSNNFFLSCVLQRIFSMSFERMDKIIVLGRDMRQLFEQKVKMSKKITVIENWSDTENIQQYPIIAAKKRNFLFAGNMGRLQGIEELLESLRETKNCTYNFTFLGNGALDDFISKYIKVNNLTQVDKYDWVERNRQSDFISASTIGVVSLKKNMYGLGVPSKFYSLLAAGKPIFYIGDEGSELHLVLKEYNIGWFAPAGNPLMISQKIKEIINTETSKIRECANNARKLAEEKYQKEIVLSNFAELFA